MTGGESGNPHIVNGEIIDQIQSRMNDGFFQVEQEAFRRGDRVEIREGPFRGFAGVFQKEVKARDRVMILLSTIAYQARVEVEKGFLARA
jgi:transcription antitermination factor NusG